MKTSIELMNVKGIKCPDFNEPNGEEFEKVMKDINVKVQKLRQKKNDSLSAIKKYTSELKEIKFKLLTTEDDFEIIDLKKRKKEVQEKLDNTEDLSDLDLQGYIENLISHSRVQKLLKEATRENQNKRNQIKKYQSEITKQYERSMAVTQQFVADYGSESSYNIALRIYGNLS